MSLDLDREVKTALLATAREAIASRLEARSPSWPELGEKAQASCGAFVTLHDRGRLRGCIGRMFAAEPLAETVRAMAVAAAFEDPRFRPLARHELDGIDIEITALSPLRKIASVEEIEVGRHGIYITKGWHSGVLLPQVAVEQGWDRGTFLEQTCYKAGLPSSAWKDPGADIQIFEGVVFGEREEELR